MTDHEVAAQPADDRSGEDLGVLLVSASARLNRLYARLLGQLDTPLTFRQHRLLRRADEGHTSMAALAAFGNLTVPTVSESVEVLVRRGLMTRRENPKNRRSLLLGLTPAGLAAKEAGDAALADASDHLLQAVPEELRTVLHDCMTKVFDAATELFQSLDDTASARVPVAPRASRS